MSAKKAVQLVLKEIYLSDCQKQRQSTLQKKVCDYLQQGKRYQPIQSEKRGD